MSNDADILKGIIQELVVAALERMIVSGDALVYFAEWIYTVQTVHAGSPPTFDLASTDPRMPNLMGAQVWPGISGAWASPAVGSTCRVRFGNADRRKPMIVGLDPNSGQATSVSVAGGGAAVARVGDTVTITQAELTSAGAVAGSNPVTVTSPIQCKVTSGSSIAGCGG